MILPILVLGDKRLRKTSSPVEASELDKTFHKLVKNMFETMYAAPGVGLAAVQVGVLKRFMTLDITLPTQEEEEEPKRNPMLIINPELVDAEGVLHWEEGCLSCPELVVETVRKKKIKIKYKNVKWEECELMGEDLLSVALQHEIDHMDGKLIIDQLSSIKRNMYIQKLKTDFKGPVVR